jgi:selT/selW/selH-like putative selenoprotein
MIDPELIASGGGVFEVEVDGQLVFSKKALDRFPTEGEVAAAIKQLADNGK